MLPSSQTQTQAQAQAQAPGQLPPPRGIARVWHWFLGRPGTRHDHLQALDGLRGLAVLIVLASHWSNVAMFPPPALSGTGKSGVYLFFVLSAFLLTRALLQRPPAGFADRGLWADYALRRFLRIWPLYLVVLLSSWLLTLGGVEAWHYRMDTASLWRHLTLREGYSVLWSIPVEFIFYAWLPLVALALAWMRARGWPLWLELATLALVLAAASARWPPGQTLANDARLGPYLVVFLCGAYAARLDHRLRATGSGQRPGAWALAGVLALGAWVVTVPAVWAGLSSSVFAQALNHTWFIWFGVLWSVLLLAVLHGPDWLRVPFTWAPLRLVGVVSFSLYLWHMPVLQWLGADAVALSALLAPWLVVAAALLAAMLSFLLFERPLRELRLGHPRTTSAQGTAAPQ